MHGFAGDLERCGATSSAARPSARPSGKTREVLLHRPQLLQEPESACTARESMRSNFLSMSKSDASQLASDAGVARHAGQQIANLACQHTSHLSPTRSNCPSVAPYYPHSFRVALNNLALSSEGQTADALGCFPLGASGPQPVSGFPQNWMKEQLLPGDCPIQESFVKRGCVDRNYLTGAESNNATTRQFAEDIAILGPSSLMHVPQSKRSHSLERGGSVQGRCKGCTDCTELRTVFYKRGLLDEHANPSVVVQPTTRSICFTGSPNPDFGVHHVGKSCRGRAGRSEIKPCLCGLAGHFAEEDMRNRSQQQLWQSRAATCNVPTGKFHPDLYFKESGGSKPLTD